MSAGDGGNGQGATASPVAAGAAPAAAAASNANTGWVEYSAPDGRVYYHNAGTGKTQWTKPEEMMTPVEVSRDEELPTMLHSIRLDTDLNAARPSESAMERILGRRWPEVLVQHRDSKEFMGDARSLQEGSWSDIYTRNASVSTSAPCSYTSEPILI